MAGTRSPLTVRKPGYRPLAAVYLTAALFSLYFLAAALWIPLKAELAQQLIERSWARLTDDGTKLSPWPWADMRPLGVLRVPSRNIRQLLLGGNSGRNLAFGPVLHPPSAAGRDWIVSGHRDTHFRFLADLEPGELIEIETPDETRRFRVSQIDVIDSRAVEIVVEPGLERISLVTCYPFDALAAGGPLRYVVTALPVQES